MKKAINVNGWTGVQRMVLFALIGSIVLKAASVSAATYYWDNNGTTAGFGTAGGIWAAPTVSLWSLSTDGTGIPEASITTATTDLLNFGNGAIGLGTNTITVSGTVASSNMTFASGSGVITLSGGTITLAPTATITVNNSADTIGSILGGAATSLTKDGTGTLTLTGANTYSGTTTINAGTLQIGNNGTSGTLGSGSVLNNGRLCFHRTDTTTFNGTITGGGELIVARGGTLTLASGANVTQFQVYGGDGAAQNLGAGTFVVQSNASLTVSGWFLLGNQRNQSGTFNQSGGTVNLTSSTPVGNEKGEIRIGHWDSNSSYNLSGGTLSALNADITLSWDGHGTLAVSGGTANLRGVKFCTGNKSRTGTLNLSGTGILNIGAGGLYDGSTSANPIAITFSGGTLGALANWTTSGNQMNNQTITLSNTNTIDTTGGNITLTPALTGAGGITKVGAGTLTFSGPNTYTGATTISNGTLKTTLSNILPQGAPLSIESGAFLELSTTTQTVARLTLSGTLYRRGVSTWGAVGSGAQYESNQIIGSGRLNVLGPARPGTFVSFF